MIAIIFTSRLSGEDAGGYEAAGRLMEDLVAEQPGYISHVSVRSPDGEGITVSYWRDREAARLWAQHPEHLRIQQRGKSVWYSSWTLRICEVQSERSSS